MDRRHRAIHYAWVDTRPDLGSDAMSISLTEAKEAVRRTRRAADVFHAYDTTRRDGTPIHVVYAHYQAGRTDVAFAGHAVTYLYEITTEAVLATFGLAPRPDTQAA